MLALCVALFVAACGNGSEQAGTPSTTDAIPAKGRALLPITDTPASYRIVYRLEDHAGGDEVERLVETVSRTTTEVVIIDRPYRSRRTLWTGTDTSAEPNRISVSDFGMLSLHSENSTDLTVSTPPVPATGDLRLEHSIEALVDQGRLVPRDRGEVLGTECQIYRTGEPIGTGRLTLPQPDEWTDVCIDARGLVLEELWYLDARLLQRRVAVDIEIDPAIPAGTFEPFSQPLSPEDGGGAVLPVDPSSRPNYIFWELSDPPAGFTHRGRFEVLTPSGERSLADPSEVGPPRREVVDVYERGPDFVVISRGSFIGREGEFEAGADDVEVDLGDLGTGVLEAGVFGSWLRIKTDAVQFLSIRGTVTTDDLVAMARDLRPSDRGQLVYLGEEPS